MGLHAPQSPLRQHTLTPATLRLSQRFDPHGPKAALPKQRAPAKPSHEKDLQGWSWRRAGCSCWEKGRLGRAGSRLEGRSKEALLPLAVALGRTQRPPRGASHRRSREAAPGGGEETLLRQRPEVTPSWLVCGRKKLVLLLMMMMVVLHLPKNKGAEPVQRTKMEWLCLVTI